MIQFTGSDLGYRFPEFAGLAEGRVQACLQAARSHVDEPTFGTDAREALMLYTAHELAHSDPARRGGVGIAEERVGDVQRKYNQDPANADTDVTGYLIQFRRLALKYTLGGIAVGAPPQGCL